MSHARAGERRQHVRERPARARHRLIVLARYGPEVATWEDVSRIALGLPQTIEETSRGNRRWTVKDKLFVWERPLRRSDLQALGDAAPAGPILGARVEHLI